MTLFLEGLLAGLLLAVSLGPIFIALTQTSLEKGIKPGITVGTGIWFSDILIVFLLYKFIDKIKDTIESETFIFWMGMSGAIVLLFFGVALLIKKPELKYEDVSIKKMDYLGYWLKGFLVNTINPFTFVYWIGIISTYLIGRGISDNQLFLLLGTIITVIILSDTAKVYMANALRTGLNKSHINYVANLSGIILILFGLFLAFKSI